MKIKYFISLAFLLFVTLHTYADDGQSLETNVSVALGINTLEFRNKIPGGFKQVLETRYTSLNLGLSTAYDRFYVALNSQLSASANADFEQFSGGVSTSATRFVMNRDESSITLGGQLVDAVTLYVGYTVGTNSGGTQHEDKGNFYGIDYKLPIKSDQSLRLHVAFADLEGSPINSCNYTGDTTGYSYGVTWSVPTKNDRLFFVKFAMKSYEFTGASSLGGACAATMMIDQDYVSTTIGTVF